MKDRNPHDAPVAESPHDTDARTSRRRVWLLEDSGLEAAVAVRALESHFDVEAFADGSALLEALTVRDAPDALVLDWNVPGLSGVEVLGFVRRTRDEISLPALMLTGMRMSSHDLLEALNSGANDFVRKPYTAAELSARVRGLVRIRELHARARRAEELGQQLMGIVSHDLRNPIGAITFSAAALLGQGDLDARQHKAVSRIAVAADRATRMIRDLLDFTQARLGAGIPVERRALDLHAHVRQVADEVAVAHPARRIDILHHGEASGSWDPDRVAQIVTNLLSNAVKYSPEHTTVRVATAGEDEIVVVEVHNDGAPIPAELLPRLFAPMQRGPEQIDRTGHSIGLGLYIVDAIVRAHGGSIDVRSTTEHGTTFTVRLPRNG